MQSPTRNRPNSVRSGWVWDVFNACYSVLAKSYVLRFYLYTIKYAGLASVRMPILVLLVMAVHVMIFTFLLLASPRAFGKVIAALLAAPPN